MGTLGLMQPGYLTGNEWSYNQENSLENSIPFVISMNNRNFSWILCFKSNNRVLIQGVGLW